MIVAQPTMAYDWNESFSVSPRYEGAFAARSLHSLNMFSSDSTPLLSYPRTIRPPSQIAPNMVSSEVAYSTANEYGWLSVEMRTTRWYRDRSTACTVIG